MQRVVKKSISNFEYYRDELGVLYCGDCLEVLKRLPSNCVSSVVTDPPYGIGFMSKNWDSMRIVCNIELWKEVLRVLKPGGHLLSFSGSRTYHRIACAIEDAGFEIKDMIEWIYGQGFPKSLDIGKAIDRMKGLKGEVIGKKKSGILVGGNYAFSQKEMKNSDKNLNLGVVDIISLVSPEVKQWEGWGTALKPAHEPICFARKPLGEKGVVQNILRYGTGGINIDGSRVPLEKGEDLSRVGNGELLDTRGQGWGFRSVDRDNRDRLPTNVIHDGSDVVLGEFKKVGISSSKESDYNWEEGKQGNVPIIRCIKSGRHPGDVGTPARFFKSCIFEEEDYIPFVYCAKPTIFEKDEGAEDYAEKGNLHPTVKPINLMVYLVGLITPPDGIVLDMFAGSGTTLIASKKLDFRYIGIEKEKEYCEISKRRLMALDTKVGIYQFDFEGF